MEVQTHHRHVRVFFTIAVFTVVLTSRAWGVSYTAIDLNPSGYADGGVAEVYASSGSQQVGYVAGSATGGNIHAFVWNGNASNYVDLHPSGFYESYALGISGSQQVGYGSGAITENKPHALVWNGSASSYVDLNPNFYPVLFDSSWAYGTDGTYQVGMGWSERWYSARALMWHGSAESFVILHPSGYEFSRANGISGNQQVGFAGSSMMGSHAALWYGSADSFIDLNPDGYAGSWANGTNGTQQIGWGSDPITGNHHALLWNGSASDYINLTPSGFIGSEARGINGTQQVGSVDTGNHSHAFLWNGSPDNYVDLHAYLPPGLIGSVATGIDSYGNVVGYAYDNDGSEHAILWQIPEPASVILISAGFFFVRSMRKQS